MTVVGYAYDAAIHCPKCTFDYARQIPYKDYDFQDGLFSDEDISDYNPGIIDLSKAIELGIIKDSEGNEIHAVFDTEETDTPEHCDDCHVFIESSWTGECVVYVIDALADYVINGDGNLEVLNEWADHLKSYNTDNVDEVVLLAFRNLRNLDG